MAVHGIDRSTRLTSEVDLGPVLTRARFALLWVVGGCALAGTMAVFFYEPSVLAEGVAGEMEGEAVTTGTALMTAAMIALPLVMAVVTLFLPLRAGVIANLVAGVPLGAFGVFAITSHLLDGSFPAHLTLVVLSTLIVWLIVGLSIAAMRRTPTAQ